jgi:hypothetical protein
MNEVREDRMNEMRILGGNRTEDENRRGRRGR